MSSDSPSHFRQEQAPQKFVTPAQGFPSRDKSRHSSTSSQTHHYTVVQNRLNIHQNLSSRNLKATYAVTASSQQPNGQIFVISDPTKVNLTSQR